MELIKLEEYTPGEEAELSNLIRRVYDEFVAIDYSSDGNNFFYDWINPNNIAERQKIRNNILVAKKDSQIVGMIEMRNGNTVSLLFVNQNFHNRGIAKQLFTCAIKSCKKAQPDITKFYVHASPFSIPVYKKLGFIETDTMQEQNGIKYMPMEMITAKDS
jgi:predicted GNAT family N-acyltransferase